ncbi:hypothetical protein [Burkholderia gladioli]|uniref:hypothetical protein n=1 Tax=Burkholderia gladioli TaxID=28095 RepID=UPI00163E6096|nr:hypothetical protein [Burkholderia gladioli]
MKFYTLLGAVDSAVRVGQDVADDFVKKGTVLLSLRLTEGGIFVMLRLDLRCSGHSRFREVGSSYCVSSAFVHFTVKITVKSHVDHRETL